MTQALPVHRVHRENLPALIAEFCKKGARPMTITLRTIKDLTKAQSAQLETHELIKIARHSVFINFDYSSSVNRQREREGKETDFKGRGSHFIHKEGDPRPIVRNKNDESLKYLQVKVEKRLAETFISAKSGEVLDNDLVHSVIKRSDKPNQGTDKAIITMAPSLDSIVSLVCDGAEYAIID